MQMLPIYKFGGFPQLRGTKNASMTDPINFFCNLVRKILILVFGNIIFNFDSCQEVLISSFYRRSCVMT